LFLRYPWRPGELLVLSGDVVADFDTDLLPAFDGDICGFAKHASFSQGSRHGVFKFDPLSETVVDYFQKAPESFLAKEARIEGTDDCALDMGLISLSALFFEALGRFASADGKGAAPMDWHREDRNRFNLFGELLTACLPSLDWKHYRKRMGNGSTLSEARLRSLFETCHCFPLRGVITRSSSFLHLGGVQDFQDACRVIVREGFAPFYANPHDELHPEVAGGTIGLNSVDAFISGESNTVENCSGVTVATAGNCVLAGVESWSPPYRLPSNLCIEERTFIQNREAVRVRMAYGAADAFQAGTPFEDLVFCGAPLASWQRERGLEAGDLWDMQSPRNLCDARLFTSVMDDDFFEGYWRSPRDAAAWREIFRGSRRYSLNELNGLLSAETRDEARGEKRRQLLRRRFLSGRGFRSIAGGDFARIVSGPEERAAAQKMTENTDDPLLRLYRAEMLSWLGSSAVTPPRERLRIPFLQRGISGAPLRVSVKEDQIVWARAPLRFDLAGGWSDTPPYTNRYGGEVVNVAVDLNGQSPVQVFVRRTREPRVRIHSIDLGITETIQRASGIFDFRDPASPYALPKAALALLGIGSGLSPDASLVPSLAATGGGLEVTLLCAVPKGSGLGTSSILAGTILAALERFYGIAVAREDLFLQVLEMEQMLTTGGGWQDQIGGLVGGVKCIENKPSLRPSPKVYQLDPFLFEDPVSLSSMTLFYTGITRLAKNILQDVVSRVNAMTPAYLFTHRCLRMLALEARAAVSLRDRMKLASVVHASFRENILIHESTTNAEMEGFIQRTKPWYTGMKLLGAGGGGFALFISETPKQADELKAILARDFEDDRARLVDFSLNKRGLAVTVS
jgi:galactokinase/mevalonate kinase-like predicted kinase